MKKSRDGRVRLSGKWVVLILLGGVAFVLLAGVCLANDSLLGSLSHSTILGFWRNLIVGQLGEGAGEATESQGVAFHFTTVDWVVVALYLVFTTILGTVLAGKQATIRDFFLGGRKLPWTAVSGSIIATEISAVTFIGIPAMVYAGNMTYLQLVIGFIVSRFIIAYFFVPAFYEQEIYSPYHYMGIKLGPRVDRVTSGLFFVGAILGQGVRVYAVALVLEVVTMGKINIIQSVVLIGLFAILWTFIGGIRTVVWTDVIQFLVFLFGGIIAFIFILKGIPGGFSELTRVGSEYDKFRILNLTTDPTVAFTIWAGLFGTLFLGLGSHGTDQMMAQRMFCCKNQRAARTAIITSAAAHVMTFLMMMVGAGLFVYYMFNPMGAGETAMVADKYDRVFPIFIVEVLPIGITGLVIAGLFAAAISSLDSALAALSQTCISGFYKPLIKPEASERHYIKVSRILIIFWGIALSAFAVVCNYIKEYPDLINLALGMTSYTYGALLGTFLLALLPTNRNDRGLLWGVPCAVLIIFALTWHQTLASIVLVVLLLVLVGLAFYVLRREPAKILVVCAVAAVIFFLNIYHWTEASTGVVKYFKLAWPWNYPLGVFVTLGLGYLLGRPRT